MKPERWQQLDALFHSALERKPEERAAFLHEPSAGDGLPCNAQRKQPALSFDSFGVWNT